MQKQIEYAVVLIRVGECKELYEKIKPTFDIAKGAYATEMSLLTGEKELYYKLDKEDDPAAMYCLAVDKNNVVLGFIYLEVDERTMTLWTCHVYVRPECRKQGVYIRMMDRVKKFAKDCKFNKIFSFVHEDNMASQCAHLSVGFVDTWHGFQFYITENDNEL